MQNQNNNQKFNVVFTEEQVQILSEFLNRVEYKGLVEVTAINSIMDSFSAATPVQEEVKENTAE